MGFIFESKLGKSNASCFELSRQKQVKWVTPKEGVVIQYNYDKEYKDNKTFILLTAFELFKTKCISKKKEIRSFNDSIESFVVF